MGRRQRGSLIYGIVFMQEYYTRMYEYNVELPN